MNEESKRLLHEVLRLDEKVIKSDEDRYKVYLEVEQLFQRAVEEVAEAIKGTTASIKIQHSSLRGDAHVLSYNQSVQLNLSGVAKGGMMWCNCVFHNGQPSISVKNEQGVGTEVWRGDIKDTSDIKNRLVHQLVLAFSTLEKAK